MHADSSWKRLKSLNPSNPKYVILTNYRIRARGMT